jgi:signal-transduction protein with cAMP-binding, CBS, and nucleotidyltransferase domain
MICPTCGHDNLPGVEFCSHCQQDLTPLDRPRADNRVERHLMEEPAHRLKCDPPPTIRASATLGEAIHEMLEHNVGALLVVDDQGALLGIFTERDLLKRVAGIHDPFAHLPVSQFMTRRPETVAANETLNYVLHKMDGGGYRHVPVVDGDRPVCVISVRDMLRHLMRLCKEA